MSSWVTATLGGVPLSLPRRGISWELRAGVKPVQKTFVVTRSRGEEIMRKAAAQLDSGGAGLELVISAPGYEPLRVKGLQVIQQVPVDENNVGVVCADSRWLLARRHVTREYNVRRTTGEYRLVRGAMQPMQLGRALPDVAYRRATLKQGKPWTAREILEDVLLDLFDGDRSRFLVDALPFSSPVEGLVLDDSGQGALGRVLGYLAGAKVYVDTRGVLVVTDRLNLAETAVVSRVEAEWRRWWPGTKAELVKRDLIRPRGVDCLFEVEAELRFDYEEGVAQSVSPGREPLLMENVLPVKDPQLEVNGKTVARGTWVPVSDWLAAVNAQADYPNFLGPLSKYHLRRYYLQGYALLAGAVKADVTGKASPLLWGSRIGAILKHWRRTFRILPQWQDKIRSLKAVRAAILDQEHGTRAAADVFMDFSTRSSYRSLVRHAGQLAGHGFTAWQADVSDATPAPATVTIMDQGAGVLHVDFRSDPWGDAEAYAPGKIDESTMPPLAVGSSASRRYLTWADSLLSPTFRCSIILTALKGTPNDEGRHHRVPVSQREAEVKLGLTPSEPGRAPVWTVKVGAGVETARFAWIDSRAEEIKEAFFSGKPMPTDLLVNRDAVSEVARATAARIYALLRDRVEGKFTVSLDPSIEPVGNISSVVHKVASNGSVSTTVTLPPITAPPDLWALLPDSVRKVIMKQVEE